MTEKTTRHYAHLAVYLIVFMTGAAVMVIEMLGTRVIAPFYGTSLYVWSSIISVTMIALAIGYFSGGRLADRFRGGGLSLIIVLAGLFTLMIPWVTRWVLIATDVLGLRAGAFVSALVLFTPCLTLLGMVGPFAIKLATERLSGVGTSAGTIYAVSTIGSVLGTLALGFFLFPLLGSRAILMGLGLALLVLGLLVALYERRLAAPGRGWASTLAVVALALVLLPQVQRADRAAGPEAVYQVRMDRESLYGWVRVLDDPKRNMRLLTSDASVIGAAKLSDGVSLLNYQLIIGLIPEFVPGIHRVLLIGQGAGHMAMDLRDRYGIVTDTLEIDPAVADAAGEFFGFRPNGQAVVGDGRYEIRRLQGPYDLIIHDCFTGGSEPTHLLTVETFMQLRGLLAESGILALNYVAFHDEGQNRALASVVKTMGRIFPERKVLRNDPDHDFNDFVILASGKPIDFASGYLSTEKVHWLKVREVSVNAEVGDLLSDDFNPLEHHQLRKSEQYRALVAEWLGADLMVR
jgi:MFS family permease